MRHVHLVVLDEGDAALEAELSGERVHALEHLLPRLVRRVRLAGEDELDRTPRIDQQALQPVEVSEDQGRALVGREPPGEPDCQGPFIEQGAGADQVQRLLPLLRPAPPGVFADRPQQRHLHLHVRRPQGGVIHGQHAVPESRLVHAVYPAVAELRVERLGRTLRHPGGQVHAVRHVADRDTRRVATGPKVTPHASRFDTVAPRDAVHMLREPDREDGHVEMPVVARRVMPQPQHGLAAHAHLLPDRTGARLDLFAGERVVAGSEGRVGREHAGRPDLPHRLVERHPLRDQLAHPLQQHERRVPFVGVPGRGPLAQRAQHADATNAQDPLLPQPEIQRATVQPV